MKTEQSVTLLNQAVADELVAVHQYMYFHFHLDDQGFTPLSELFKRTAIVEMGHVDKLAERILFLGGDVNMKPNSDVATVKDPVEILTKASDMERQSAEFYNRAAQDCASRADAVSKQLFESLVQDEEEVGPKRRM